MRHASFNLLYTALIQRRALASCGFALLLRCRRSIHNPNRVGCCFIIARITANLMRHASFNLLYTALIQRRALASCGFALLLRCRRSIHNPNRVGCCFIIARITANLMRHASFNLLYTALIQRRALASCGVSDIGSFLSPPRFFRGSGRLIWCIIYIAH